MIEYSSLWDKREMKKGKKQHWGFTCFHCKEKFSSKFHTEYFLINHYMLQNVDYPILGEWDYKLICSKNCVLNHLKEHNINPDEAVRKIKEFNSWVEKNSSLYN